MHLSKARLGGTTGNPLKILFHILQCRYSHFGYDMIWNIIWQVNVEKGLHESYNDKQFKIFIISSKTSFLKFSFSQSFRCDSPNSQNQHSLWKKSHQLHVLWDPCGEITRITLECYTFSRCWGNDVDIWAWNIEFHFETSKRSFFGTDNH